MLSIYFHDVIYDVFAAGVKAAYGDNEDQSAQVFITFAQQCSRLSAQQVSLVETFIKCTKSHSCMLDNQDLRYFLDFDLAVLAWEPQGSKHTKPSVARSHVIPHRLAIGHACPYHTAVHALSELFGS